MRNGGEGVVRGAEGAGERGWVRMSHTGWSGEVWVGGRRVRRSAGVGTYLGGVDP